MCVWGVHGGLAFPLEGVCMKAAMSTVSDTISGYHLSCILHMS